MTKTVPLSGVIVTAGKSFTVEAGQQLIIINDVCLGIYTGKSVEEIRKTATITVPPPTPRKKHGKKAKGMHPANPLYRTIPDVEQAILQFLIEHGTTKSSEVSNKLGLHYMVKNHYLYRRAVDLLVDRGDIERIGKGSGQFLALKKKGEEAA